MRACSSPSRAYCQMLIFKFCAILVKVIIGLYLTADPVKLHLRFKLNTSLDLYPANLGSLRAYFGTIC